MKHKDRKLVRLSAVVHAYADTTKTEDGVAFPKAAYAYTPSDEPSTWKIRLWETPDKKETPRQVGMAIAAMGKGFRGNKADIPEADRASVMAKIRAAYRKANNGKDMPGEMMHALLDGADVDVSAYLLEYEQLNGVELFATGEHNGDKYTEADLDAMVNAFHALDFQPALKAGHTDAPGTPALGYVTALRREGSKLLADLSDIPAEVYRQIKDKRFNRLSAEIYWNLERAGKTYKRALKAVALLGAGVPGVAGLKPLSAAFAEIQAEAKYYDKPNESEDSNVNEEERKALEAKVRGELCAQYEADVKAAAERMFAGTEERIRKMEEDRQKEIRQRERDEENKRHQQQEDRLKAIELERKHDRIAAVTGRCTVPAFRPYLERLCEIVILMPDHDQKKYEVAEQGSKEPAQLTGLQVVEKLAEAINAKAARLFREHTKLLDYVAPAGDTIDLADRDAVGREVDRLTQAYMTDKKVTDYAAAMNAVLAVPENHELKEAYAKPRTRAA